MTAIAALGAALLMGAAAEPAIAQPSPKPPLQTYTDKLLFDYSMDRFQSVRDDSVRDDKSRSDKLDWSSDGCSQAPNRPMGFNFLPSCQRHDFGYRNYKKQGRFDHTTRLAVDKNFKADMYAYCRTLPKAKTGSCKYWAGVYYGEVRKHGGP
ncbi:phospholipase [Streptomyces aureoversilis]|uniref:Phospholipase n=1 Tax=Streptomyces aureoversilis TaxID=67277 RepID=A0ABW0A9Z7_9ACTN